MSPLRTHFSAVRLSSTASPSAGRAVRAHRKPVLPPAVADLMTMHRYYEYLRQYNGFVLFRWQRDNDDTWNYSYDLCWRDFCAQTHRMYRARAVEQPLFLANLVNTRLLNRALGSTHTDAVPASENLNCTFLQVGSDVSVSALIEYLKQSQNKTEPKLQPVSVALKLAGSNSHVVSYMQALVQESTKMFERVNYEKLLQIAKQSSETQKNPAKMHVRELLISLARCSLSNPQLTPESDWMLFSLAGEAKPRR
ncbi:LAMI_0G02850g1_1 [Lachancea mirantina]|uniref:LAMI_0G02850g1_1 n=1 Tax=Lachancea mirantina TaxID=1230905 RepID=A0A1G4K7W7_9SACH|nr:LAMI_0G02850g1_1 [Lachancea mirantina]